MAGSGTSSLLMAALCAFAAAAPAAAQPDSMDAIFEARSALERLAWLSGHWEAEHEQLPGVPPTWSEEVWSDPRGAMMIGFVRRGQGVRLGSWEWLRIGGDEAGHLSLYAQTDAEGATVAYPLVRSGASEAVFENPVHDYPQRMVYRRQGDRLTIALSQMDGSEARSRDYRLRSGNPREVPGR